MTRTPLSDPPSASGPSSGPRNRNRRRVRPALATGLLALSLMLASCGKSDRGTEATPTSGFSDFAWGGINPAGDAPLPDAEPMLDTAPTGASRYLASSGPAPVQYLPQYRDYPADDGGYVSDPDAGAYDMLALASTLGAVFGSAPPDYGFDYGDERPWAWETGDRYVRYAEPIDQGYRYYYYGPDSDQPYLVRDPWYSYGYRDGRLAQIYGRDGRVLDARRALVQRRMADRYYARALAMRRAAESERHQGVSAQNWARHRVAIARAQDDWDRDAARRPGWEQWNDRHAPVVAARWTQERAVRRFAGDRFARWQQAGFRGKSPDFYREAADDSRLQRDIRTQRQQAVRQAQMQAQVQAQIGQASRRDNREQDRQREQQAQREQVQREQQQRLIAARTQRQQMQQQRQSQAREVAVHRQQAAQMQQQRQSQAREVAVHRQQAARMQQQRQSQAREVAVHRQQAARAQQQRQSQEREVAVHRQQAARAQQQRQSQAREVAVHRQQAARMQQRRLSQVREASVHRQQAARMQQRRQSQAREAAVHRQQAARAQQQRQAQARQAQSRPHGGGHGGPRDGHGGGHPGHP